MPILATCCCWRSVRHGSIACGIYTGIYYMINAVHSSYLLREEIRFLRNISSFSLVDSELITETSAVFSSLILVFSICGVISTFLLLIGIYKNIKYLLVPWIFNLVFFTIIDVIYIIHGLLIHALQWNPSVAILITIDFFLNTLNLYATLCVISQYQEYKAGRGKAINPVQKQASTTHITVTQPSKFTNHQETSNNDGRSDNLQVPQPNKGKKSVKFGETPEIGKIVIVGGLWGDEKRHVSCRGIDTAPLIDTGGNESRA